MGKIIRNLNRLKVHLHGHDAHRGNHVHGNHDDGMGDHSDKLPEIPPESIHLRDENLFRDGNHSDCLISWS